ncbi:hypothetical protein AwPolaro_00740 [Polaromonas sp.]|nr:hypothetical protein AwPolaro_00740 [Polaromonas sp.]
MSLLIALLVTWAVLAVVWILALPKSSNRVGWLYPLLPLIAGVVLWRWPDIPVLRDWMEAAVWLWAGLSLVWLVSVLKRDSSIMDIAYGYLMCALPWWMWLHNGSDMRAWLPLLLTTLGFGRYSIYITWRNLPNAEDARYARWRQRSGANWWWWSYFQVFLLQGVVLWFWVFALVLAIVFPQDFGLWHVAGALVWLIGFVFEVGGDWQLAQFKRKRKSSSELLNTGLWALTRHPNYFGQTAMWWGYGLIAMASPYGWLGLLSLAYITWFMYTGSATSLMERHLLKTKPGYAEYCGRVPAFFPRLKP